MYGHKVPYVSNDRENYRPEVKKIYTCVFRQEEIRVSGSKKAIMYWSVAVYITARVISPRELNLFIQFVETTTTCTKAETELAQIDFDGMSKLDLSKRRPVYLNLAEFAFTELGTRRIKDLAVLME